jgi:hypothetical protein
VLAACAVQALVFQHQALNRTPADNVGVHDFIHVRQRDSAIPDGLGIDHEIRPVFALVQAAGLVGAHSTLQTALSEFQLKQLLQLGPGGWITTSARVSGRPLVPADKNMALEFRHPTIVQDWRRMARGDILISIEGIQL